MRSGVTNKYSDSGGFTFIEMMVVLAILSVAMFVLVPKVINGVLEKRNAPVKEINGILQKAKQEALTKKETIRLRFVLGSSNFYFKEKVYTLPEGAELIEAKLNEKRPEGLDFYVNIYPDGICDYFEFKLSGNKKLLSRPLLCEVSFEGT